MASQQRKCHVNSYPSKPYVGNVNHHNFKFTNFDLNQVNNSLETQFENSLTVHQPRKFLTGNTIV